MDNFNTPILFIIFNRPEETKTTFAEIKKIKPTKLFVAADGPRNEEEKEKCEKTREIIKEIDWDCEVKTLFREENLGCRVAPATAIDWFFENVNEGIILEDDCVPSKSFFTFCTTMLSYYKDNNQIMCISGDNFQNGIPRGDGSYYFSRIPNTWGWATWKRAWNLYDIDMKDLDNFIKNNTIKKIFKSAIVRYSWLKIFKNTKENKLDVWDYQWAYTLFKNNGLSINPNLNLVSNIGFGGKATHTTKANKFSDLKRHEINNIKHPTQIKADENADKLILNQIFEMNLYKIIKRKIKKLF